MPVESKARAPCACGTNRPESIRSGTAHAHVPEPSPGIMIGVGLAAWGMLSRRR